MTIELIEQNFLKIINNTLKNNSFLGDDCAHLKDFGLCITQDTLYEGVHFDLKTINPRQLGRKSVLVNISDILASGARPNYLTIALSGSFSAQFLQAFYFGVQEVCEEYSVTVVGGDLTGGKALVVSVCALGDTKGRNIASRKNAQKGYVVGVLGDFGSSAQGFYDLKEKKENEFTKAHLEPKLHPEMSKTIATTAKKPYAMMDSSDGLFDALFQMAKQSGVRIDIEYEKIPKKTANRDFVLYGGEDYSLLAILCEEDFKNVEGLVRVGKVDDGEGVYIDGERVEDDKSYKHWD